jgi:predicted kinase
MTDEKPVEHHLIHLISGSTGAGKTTYASQLSERLKGVRFSIDEWMAALFWMDTPQPLIGSGVHSFTRPPPRYEKGISKRSIHTMFDPAKQV